MAKENINSPFVDNEQLLSSAFAYIATAIAVIDMDGKCIVVNESFCRLSGYAKKDILHKSVSDITCTDNRDLEMKFKDELLNGKRKNYSINKQLIHKEGFHLQIILTVSTVPTYNTQPQYFVAEFKNISESESFLYVNNIYKREFKTLFQLNPDPVFLLDSNGNFIAMNQATSLLAEADPAELVGKNFSIFCEREDLLCIQQNFSKAQKGRSFNFEIAITTLKGKHRYLNITNAPVFSGEKIICIYCIAKDITRQKLANKEKNLSYKISNIFNAELSLVNSLDQSVKLITHYFNAAHTEVWVFNNGMNEFNLLTTVGIHKEKELSPSAIEIELDMVNMASIEKKPVWGNHIKTKTGGEETFHSVVAIPLISKDEAIAVVLLFFETQTCDLSLLDNYENFFLHLAENIQRKKSEQESNQFFTLSSDMFCIAGKDGSLKKINDAFTKILGYEHHEILAKKFIELVYPDDMKFVIQQFNDLFQDNKIIEFEIRLKSLNSELKWVSWTFTSLSSEQLMYGVGRDVTEAKRLQKIILREQKQFFEMFNGAPVTMAILKGKDHVFESANELYLKFSGRSNVVGKKVRDVFPEAEPQGIFDKMDMVFETGKMYTSKEKHLQLDVEGTGNLTDLYLSFMFQPYRNPEDQVEGIFYFGVDVTEQVIARKKIEENNKRYADLIENLPAAVYTVNANGYIMLYNKAASLLWGREPHLGKDKWCGSWRIYNSAGRLLPHAASPMAVTLINKVPMQGEEMKFQRPDGAFRHIVSFPSPFFDIKGKLVGGINVLIDITERKKNEDELKQLSLVVRKTTDSVIMLNENGTIEWVNEAFSKLEGFSFNEVVGKKLDDLYNVGRMDLMTIKFIKEKMNKQLPFECEIRKINKNKNSTWVESKGQPVFNASGLLTNYFIIESDITEQKNAYKKLTRSENEIRNFARQINNVLEDERSRIAREIHDEFGQQLTGLKMSLSSLKNLPVKDKKLDEIVDDMKEGIERNIQFLRNISTELRPAILDTLGLGASIEWLVKEFEKRTSIPCKVKISLNKNFFSKNIAITFFRICQEALTNISRHAEASNVNIELRGNNHFLSLRINDNGKGMNSDKLEDPFSLGLIGMKERARLIGATLTLNSQKNVGTSIYLFVKLNEE